MEKYHISQLDDSFYKVSWEGRVHGRMMKIVGRFSYEGISLNSLLAAARGRVSAGVYGECKKLNLPKPMFSCKNLVWDENSEDIPAVFFKQAEGRKAGFKMVASSLNELTHVMAKKEEPERLFEIKKVNGVWTVVKHDTPLLTWEQAAKELKTKVG